MYKLRPATDGGYAFLKHLHHTAMRDVVERTWGWDEADQDRMFDRGFKPQRCQVVVVDGRDAGQLVVDRRPDHLFLQTLYILPEFQGRGLGTAIIQDVLAEANRAGLPVALSVLRLNRARRLYERLGFVATSEDETHFHMRTPVIPRGPLYGKREAACSQWREAVRESDRERFELLAAHATPCGHLVDIGCGWGQFLGLVQSRVDEIWAVDESADRIRDVQQSCSAARMILGRANALALPDAYFDVAVTSQMLHEVKRFGREGELEQTLSEIRRVLAPGGRWLLLDHLDAGDGEVAVKLPPDQMARLIEFEGKFRFYEASHQPVGEDAICISRRCLQDFLTKSHWLNTDMEPMEMNETHNVFAEQQTIDLAAAAGFAVREWFLLTDIRSDLARHGGSFVDGQPWRRKFLLVAERTA